jgi:hypothetical protein
VIRTLVVDHDFRVADIHAAYVTKMPGFEVSDVVTDAAANEDRGSHQRLDIGLRFSVALHEAAAGPAIPPEPTAAAWTAPQASESNVA